MKAANTVTCLVLAVLAVLGLGIWVTWNPPAFDRSVLSTLEALRHARLDTLFRVLTWAGSLYLLIPLTLALSYLMFAPQWRYPARQWLKALLGAALITYLLKFLFDRSRPISGLVETHLDYAFPSNHASQITAFMLMFVWLIKDRRPGWLRPAVILAVAAIMAVSASRLYLQVHHLTDVIGGILTGLIAVMLVRLQAK